MEKPSSEGERKKKGKRPPPTLRNRPPAEAEPTRKKRKPPAARPIPSPQQKRKSQDSRGKTEKPISGKTGRQRPEQSSSEKLRLNRPKPARPLKQEEVDRQAEKVLQPTVKERKTKQKPEKPLTPPKEPLSPYLRKLRGVLIVAGTVVILVAICVVLSLTVFFKIEDIQVEGKTRYGSEELITASQIHTGDNLLLCNTTPAEKNIEDVFPYVEKAEISKKLFNKILIHITEAQPTSIVESGGDYIVLSKYGKILEVNKEKTYDVPAVLGAKLKNIKLGRSIEYKDENLKKYLDKIIDTLKELKMEDIKTIDLSNTTKVTLVKNSGFQIILGTFENLEYKLRTANGILSSNVKSDALGTLDVSLASSDGGKSYLKFIPRIEESSQSSKPQESSVSSEESEEPSESEEPAEESQEEPEENTEWEEPYEEESYEEPYEEESYEEEPYEEDPYEEDPYEEDPYEEDPYEEEPYEDTDSEEEPYVDETNEDETYTDDEDW